MYEILKRGRWVLPRFCKGEKRRMPYICNPSGQDFILPFLLGQNDPKSNVINERNFKNIKKFLYSPVGNLTSAIPI